MPPFSRDRDFNSNSPQRRPKPRPSGYAPQRFDSRPPPYRDQRDRPAPRPAKPRRPAGPARIEPRQPVSGKQRRQMLKAASWRLAKIIHVRPAEVVKALSVQRRLDVAFPNVAIAERRGEAARLATKIWRLAAKPKA